MVRQAALPQQGCPAIAHPLCRRELVDGPRTLVGEQGFVAQIASQSVVGSVNERKPRIRSIASATGRSALDGALGRKIWKDWGGYHRRSLIETTMGCFKRLGEKVSARTFDRKVEELNIRAAILNQFTELVRQYGGGGMTAPEVWGGLASNRFVQQSQCTDRLCLIACYRCLLLVDHRAYQRHS